MLFACIELKFSVAVSKSLILKIFPLFFLNMKNSFNLSRPFPELILISSIFPGITAKFNFPVVRSLLDITVTVEVVYPFTINLFVNSVKRFVMSAELNSRSLYLSMILDLSFFDSNLLLSLKLISVIKNFLELSEETIPLASTFEPLSNCVFSNSDCFCFCSILSLSCSNCLSWLSKIFLASFSGADILITEINTAKITIILFIICTSFQKNFFFFF